MWITQGYVDIMNSTSFPSLNTHDVPGHVLGDRGVVNQLLD